MTDEVGVTAGLRIHDGAVDLFANYGARGDAFAEAVHRLRHAHGQ
ncbi:hypothetical protein [Nocardioides pocheonensis]|nr:hypothetical protein [Nocardioides pocheonensis]